MIRRALMILALVPLAAGCGAQKQGALDNSSRAMADAGSSRIVMTLTQGKRTIFAGSGIFDYAHDRGDVVVRGSQDAMHRGLSPDVVEGRFIGSTSYMGFTLGGKKRWLKESGSVPSGTERFIPGPGGPSPGSVLNLLFKSSKEIEVLGKDEIRGVSAKHYRAHIDTKKMDQFGDSAGKVVIDAWIDDDGLLRRLRVPQAGTPQPFTAMDFFDFGVKVDIEAPPADEIMTEQEFQDLIFKECKTMEAGGSSPIVCAVFSGGGVTSSSDVTP